MADEVWALSMGPPNAEAALREAVSLGRDPGRAVVRSDAGRLGHVGDGQRPRGRDRSARRRSRDVRHLGARWRNRPGRAGGCHPARLAPGDRLRVVGARRHEPCRPPDRGGRLRAAAPAAARRRHGRGDRVHASVPVGGRSPAGESGQHRAARCRRISASTRPRSASARRPPRWRTWSRHRCPSVRAGSSEPTGSATTGWPARSADLGALVAPVDHAPPGREASSATDLVASDDVRRRPEPVGRVRVARRPAGAGVAGTALQGDGAVSRPRWRRRRCRRRQTRSAPRSTRWFVTGSTLCWSPTTRLSHRYRAEPHARVVADLAASRPPVCRAVRGDHDGTRPGSEGGGHARHRACRRLHRPRRGAVGAARRPLRRPAAPDPARHGGRSARHLRVSRSAPADGDGSTRRVRTERCAPTCPHRGGVRDVGAPPTCEWRSSIVRPAPPTWAGGRGRDHRRRRRLRRLELAPGRASSPRRSAGRSPRRRGAVEAGLAPRALQVGQTGTHGAPASCTSPAASRVRCSTRSACGRPGPSSPSTATPTRSSSGWRTSGSSPTFETRCRFSPPRCAGPGRTPTESRAAHMARPAMARRSGGQRRSTRRTVKRAV